MENNIDSRVIYFVRLLPHLVSKIKLLLQKLTEIQKKG